MVRYLVVVLFWWMLVIRSLISAIVSDQLFIGIVVNPALNVFGRAALACRLAYGLIKFFLEVCKSLFEVFFTHGYKGTTGRGAV